MPMWRRPTPEEMAHFERMMARQAARPYAPKATSASSAAPPREVVEEGSPILLVGWDDDAGSMIAFGFVGGLVGQVAGNPTVTPELHGDLSYL